MWKIQPTNGVFKGSVAGCKHSDGAIVIRIKPKLYKAHRLAWLFVYGSWPKRLIDHKNGKRDDNRICNLREATDSQNNQNRRIGRRNSTGFKGVHINMGRYRAQICVDGKSINIGNFDTALEAHEAYVSHAKIYFGEFFNSG